MHIETYGTGNHAWLAIHGWGGSQADFIPLFKRLPADLRLLSVDLPGYGATPKPNHWDLDAIMDDLCRDIEKRDLQNLSLLGFCSGAVLALFVAQRIPGRIARVVMIDPFAYVPLYFRIFLAGTFGRHAYDMTFARPIGRRITTWILRKRQLTDHEFMDSFGRVDHDATLYWLDMLNSAGGVDRFRDVSVPIEIAQGERTFGAIRDSIRAYRALWPDAPVHILRNVGHLSLTRGARQLADIMTKDGREEGNR